MEILTPDFPLKMLEGIVWLASNIVGWVPSWVWLALLGAALFKGARALLS